MAAHRLRPLEIPPPRINDVRFQPDDLILGTASGYGPERLRPFIPSLAQSGFRGRLVLFGGRADLSAAFPDLPFTLELAPAPAIRWEPRPGWRLNGYSKPLRPLHWLLPRLLTPFPGARNRLMSYFHGPASARFFHYLEYLRARAGSPPRYVLLSDVRDVFFQDDPFRDPPGDTGLSVFLEGVGLKIGEEQHTSGWVRAGFGAAGLARVADQPLSCSGVTLGTGTAMLAYLERMATRLADLTDLVAPIWGSDQGVHNYLLYTGGLPPADAHANFHGSVLTVGQFSDPAGLRWDAEGRLVGADGRLAPTVHQYDRLPFLEVVPAPPDGRLTLRRRPQA